jgi:IclR family acetate operon transcriptional repressor
METGTQSVLNALRVVQQLSDDGPVGVSDLARRLELPKSTVQRTLMTLSTAGWIRQDAQSRWALTLQCAMIGRSVVREHEVRAAAHPLAAELRDRTHETVRYFLIEGESFVLLGNLESNHAVRPVESELLGAIPMHATAVGKATLATMSPVQLDRLLLRPLASVTSKTITDPATLRADIEVTRERGWGEVREELYLDVGGVAAVAALSDHMLVAMAISFPLHRAPEKTVAAYGRMVRDAARRIAALIPPPLQATNVGVSSADST